MAEIVFFFFSTLCLIVIEVLFYLHFSFRFWSSGFTSTCVGKRDCISAFTCVCPEIRFLRSHSLSQSQMHPDRASPASFRTHFFFFFFVVQFFTMQKITHCAYINRQPAWIWCICHGLLSPAVDSKALLWVRMLFWTARKEKSYQRVAIRQPQGAPCSIWAVPRPCDPGGGMLAVLHWVWETKHMLIYQVIIISRRMLRRHVRAF